MIKKINNARINRPSTFFYLFFTTLKEKQMAAIQYIPVARYPIRLGQFLKLASLVDDGLEAKTLVQQGEILVNNEVEFRRGRQLQAGDTVKYNGKTFRLQ